MNLQFIFNDFLDTKSLALGACGQADKANEIMYRSCNTIETHKIWLGILNKQNRNALKNSSQIIKRRKFIHNLQKLPITTRVALRDIDKDILLNRKLVANSICRKLRESYELQNGLEENFLEAAENCEQAMDDAEKAIEAHESLDRIIDSHNY